MILPGQLNFRKYPYPHTPTYPPTSVHAVLEMPLRTEGLLKKNQTCKRLRHNFLDSCKKSEAKFVSFQNPGQPMGW